MSRLADYNSILDIELIERCVGHIESHVRAAENAPQCERSCELLIKLSGRLTDIQKDIEDLIVVSECEQIEQFKQQGLL